MAILLVPKSALLPKEGVVGSWRDSLKAAIPRPDSRYVIRSTLKVASFPSRYHLAQRSMLSVLQPSHNEGGQ